MNRKALVLSMATILLALCASCSNAIHTRGVRAALARAEALMETDPDSARAVLDSLNLQSSIFNLQSKDVADYAWLRTQIEYKRGIPLRSDSLARIATDYYGTPRHNNYHAAMAWYTLGCVYSDMKSDPKAVDAYLNAKQLFPDTISRYYSITLFNIGKHFLNRHMYSEAEFCFLTVKSNPFCQRDSFQLAFTDFYLGLSHLRQNRFRHAEENFYAVLHNPHTHPYVRKNIDFQLAKLNFHENHDYSTSLSYINKYIRETDGQKGNAAAWILKGDIMSFYEKYDSAYTYYQRALKCKTDIYTRNQAYKQLANVSKLAKREDSIDDYVAAYKSSLDSIYIYCGREEIDSICQAHSNKIQQLKKTSKKVLWLMIGISSAFFILLVFFFKKLIKQSAFLIHSPSLFKKTNSDKVKVKSVSREEKVSICREQFRKSEVFPLLANRRQAHSPFEKMSLQDRQMLCKEVVRITSELRSELVLDCPELTKEDIEFCLYTILGIPIKTIAYCSPYSEHALESRKSRVKHKLTSEWRKLLYEEISLSN